MASFQVVLAVRLSGFLQDQRRVVRKFQEFLSGQSSQPQSGNPPDQMSPGGGDSATAASLPVKAANSAGSAAMPNSSRGLVSSATHHRYSVAADCQQAPAPKHQAQAPPSQPWESQLGSSTNPGTCLALQRLLEKALAAVFTSYSLPVRTYGPVKLSAPSPKQRRQLAADVLFTSSTALAVAAAARQAAGSEKPAAAELAEALAADMNSRYCGLLVKS